MSGPHLDLRISIKADEETLSTIRELIIDADTDCSPVGESIGVVVQQMLVAAGITAEFEVDFQCGHVKLFDMGGGLSAEEWLDSVKSLG